MAWTKEKIREYSKEYFHKRRENDICPSCGTETDGSTYCTQCKIKRLDQTRTLVKKRKSQGMCIQCNRVAKYKQNRCLRCARQLKFRNKKWREALIREKLCTQCGGETSGKKRCESCLLKIKNREKRRRKKLGDAGLCLQCGQDVKMIHSVLCQVCYIKNKSYTHLKTTKHWKILLMLLESQGWRCPYTDEKLVLGLNDSTDHKLPKIKFPEQALDISNLEWTTRGANQMKSDRTPDEFLALVKQIHDHRSL